jgi:AraC-like DNA-binding protein
MKFILLTLIFVLVAVSIFLYLRKKWNKEEVFFLATWFLLFSSLIISTDYKDVLSENVINTFSLLFFVWLSLLSPLLYSVVLKRLGFTKISSEEFYLPFLFLFINLFSLLYFTFQKKESTFIYEVVENVMSYTNYIIILFVFPIITIYYSYLSYRKLDFKKVKLFFKDTTNNFNMFLFIFLFDIFIFIWLLTNYIIEHGILNSSLKKYYFLYFVIIGLVLRTSKVMVGGNPLVGNSLFNDIIFKLEEDLKTKNSFQNKNLNLKDYAKELGTNEKYLSQAINKNYNKNFNTFINEYRIKYATQLLLNPEFNNYTLDGIGNISGFNSKTAFNLAFKKVTGQTPSEFKSNN